MSKELIIKTQAQLDKVKPDFEGTIYIEGGERYNPIVVKAAFDYAYVIVRGQAYVEARESSRVVARGSSQVEAWGSSQVEAWGSSRVVARESSRVEAWESSQVEAWGSSQVELYGEAMVSAFQAKAIVAHGYNVISVRKSNEKYCNIVVNKDSYVKVVPDFQPTFEEYAKRYPVVVKRGKAILYKAVHKVAGEYLSDYDRSFKYVIGKAIEHEVDQSTSRSCTRGLHVSHKSWAKAFGNGWDDMALLEIEVPVSSIVIADDCDGKIRTGKLKVLREVPEEEWWGE